MNKPNENPKTEKPDVRPGAQKPVPHQLPITCDPGCVGCAANIVWMDMVSRARNAGGL